MRKLLAFIAFLVVVALATPAHAATPGCLGYIGDSLTYQAGSPGATQSLYAAGWTADTARVDGKVGRGMPPNGRVLPNFSQVVASWRSQGYDPATWVIALGSNNLNSSDAQWRSWINADLNLLTQGNTNTYTVYWVGLAVRDSATDSRVLRFQNVLNTTTHARINLIPLDWNSVIHNGRNETGLWNLKDSTGRHMTLAGYAIRNSFITSAVTPAN